MLSNSPTFSSYILAGGRSSRMGTDKGLMVFNGKPMILRIIETMQSVFDRVIIISNNEAYNSFGLEMIKDEIAGIGPAGGIHSALNHTTCDKIFITGCDMPFITSKAIEYVIDHSGTSQITVPEIDGKIEPLFGVYTKGCFEKWQSLIQKNIFKLQDIVAHFDLNKLNVQGDPEFNRLVFANLNTKEDFERTQKS